jgi:hypothetical protein
MARANSDNSITASPECELSLRLRPDCGWNSRAAASGWFAGARCF